MSMIKVFTCDVCRNQIWSPMRLYGCNFSDTKKFKLDDPQSTDGVHICFGCLRQLEAQITNTQASATYSPDNGSGSQT